MDSAMQAGYDTPMKELEHESRGDCVSYLRVDPAMFHELLVHLTLRITKVQWYVPRYTMSYTIVS